jgi:hypothetical protein
MLIICVFAIARRLRSRSPKKKVPAFGHSFCRPGLGKDPKWAWWGAPVESRLERNDPEDMNEQCHRADSMNAYPCRFLLVQIMLIASRAAVEITILQPPEVILTILSPMPAVRSNSTCRRLHLHFPRMSGPPFLLSLYTLIAVSHMFSNWYSLNRLSDPGYPH